MKKAQKGFTLVELIVVIAIIGILAAILVPSMMGYVKKSKLKSANSNAKLVFTTVNGAAADIIADGKDVSKIVGEGPTAVSSLSTDTTNNPLQAAVQKAMADNGTGAGYVYWTINASTKNVNLAQWASSTASGDIVGQYPNPETDPDEGGNVIGTSIS